MSILSTEFNPDDGKFHIMLGDDVDIYLTACQFIDFISQSNCLVDFVVNEYFDGDMEKFFLSSHLEEDFDDMDSKEIAEMMADWIKNRKITEDTGHGG
jgi:hypothetical protein